MTGISNMSKVTSTLVVRIESWNTCLSCIFSDLCKHWLASACVLKMLATEWCRWMCWASCIIRVTAVNEDAAAAHDGPVKKCCSNSTGLRKYEPLCHFASSWKCGQLNVVHRNCKILQILFSNIALNSALSCMSTVEYCFVVYAMFCRTNASPLLMIIWNPKPIYDVIKSNQRM